MAAEPLTQDTVLRWLGQAPTHAGAHVVRCDTHAASVFLAGDRALKVKRAVRFPFLDYSTIEKRKAACEAELAVNRRFAPKLYRRVVPITREADGSLALGGQGEPVEWAVEMARFDENQTLDRVAGRGALDEATPRKLATTVAAMHERAEPASTKAWLAALDDYVAQNTAEFAQHPDVFPGPLVAALERKSRAALARLRPLLLARGEAGLVRRGHGDLHLGNIALIEGEPLAFDAIEFDPVIASGDVLYDLAFLLMDLVERRLDRAANAVLNGYFEASRRLDDCDGLAALPLFMSLRAAIRAKVTAVRLAQAEAAERDGTGASALRYFHLALDLLAPPAPRLLCVGGLSGTGKSALARALAPSIGPIPGALVLRSDAERKSHFGFAETARLPPEAYREDMSKMIYATLTEKARRAVHAGHSVIVDAVFAKPQERSGIEAVARAENVAFAGLFLTADLDIRIRRIGGRGPDASDATAAVARQQEGFDLGALGWATVDASGSPETTLARARKIAG
jgi:aminoglycoside phosphotransferase family enzyme/predicted kinase